MTKPNQKPEFTLPATPEAAEQAVAAMLERGLLSPAVLAKLAEARRETGSAVFKVLEAGSVESQNEKPVTFAEAVPRLREVNFDLEKARAEAVKMHEQWGLVKALQNKGIVQNADQYGALFDNATFTPEGLAELSKKLKAGEKWMPLFNPGHLTPRELWHVLFTEGRIPYYNDSYGFQHLDELRRIDPNDIPGLKNLHKRPDHEQLQAFKQAYKKAPAFLQSPHSQRVIFTPDELEVTNVSKSATQHAQSALNGAKFVSLMDNMLRWRTQYELTGQKPDSQTWTQDPLSVYENGGVARLHWDPDVGRLLLFGYDPVRADGDLGPRAVLR